MSAKKFSLVEAFIWLLVVALLLLIASPIVVGFLFQSHYQDTVNDMSESMQGDVKILSYDRGLYSSDAVLELTLPDMPETIRFQQEIIHGPVYLGLLNQGRMPLALGVIKGRLQVPADMQQQVNRFFKGQSPLQFQEIVEFSGESSYQVYVPPVNATIQDDAGHSRVLSSGALLTGRYVAADMTSTGELNMPHFSFSGQGGTFSVDAVKMNFSTRKGQTGMLTGDSNIGVKKIDFQSEHDQFAMHDLTLNTVTNEVGRLINSSLNINTREIYASNERFGPVNLNLIVNGLNADALLKIQDMQQQVETKRKQGIPEEQINAMVAGQMMGLVPELIKQADMRIKPLKLQSELGVAETNLSFSVEGLDGNAPADPMFMLGALNVDVDLSVDEPLMKQIIEWQLMAADRRRENASPEAQAMMPPASKDPMPRRVEDNLKDLLAENWLTLDEGVYRGKLSMHQGQMELNDRQVNPMQLMQKGAAARP